MKPWSFLLLSVASCAFAASSPAPVWTPAEARWPAPVRPPSGAPNILLVLWDDVGFGQFGCYGAPLATPTVDRLAAGGLRYTHFHVNSVCSPTRASLLTGRNSHAVGVGHIGEYANGARNNLGGPHLEAGTVADYLRAGGYATAAFGKWHLAPMSELNQAASSAYWPTGRGFDRFYGFMGGDMNQFAPEIFSGRERVKPRATRLGGAEPYFMDTDLCERTIAYLAEHRATAPEQPFFVYLSLGAGHAPHHASPELLAKWRGRFDDGWDAYRERTLARQIELGIVPMGTKLPPANPGVKPWAALTAEERRVFARYYECFAACMEAADRELGRVVDWLEQQGLLRDTLILLLSDNGASPEGGPEGIWNELRLFAANRPGEFAGGAGRLEQLGGPLTYPTYPIGWTQAGNTPFRRTKGSVHEGGVRVPLIAHWPARITDAGGRRGQFHHVVDLLPTLLEVSRLPAPAELGGRRQLPLAGASLAYTWPSDQAMAPSRRTTQYFEIHGHRAIYEGGWKAVTFHESGRPYAEDRWELYHLETDPTESRDLAAEQPERLAALLRTWEREARQHDVYPLDDRRAGPRDMIRPPWNGDRRTVTYVPPVSGLHKYTALERRDRSMTITARLTAGGDGVILAHGGRFAGYALYVLGSVPVFHYNYAGEQRTTVRAVEQLPAGASTVVVDFRLREDGGADVVLRLDGREVGRGRVPMAMSGNISHETLDLACDLYTPVSEDYAPPFAFQGTLRDVTVTADPR
ncbi:MAG: arylsulfatase [Verrucomicrobia bacterium]|nr:arylsulfatase [Verrucomicrobiota bacterium]